MWADFGAGDGTFSRALVERLGAGSLVYAVDRDAPALSSIGRLGDRRAAASCRSSPTSRIHSSFLNSATSCSTARCSPTRSTSYPTPPNVLGQAQRAREARRARRDRRIRPPRGKSLGALPHPVGRIANARGVGGAIATDRRGDATVEVRRRSVRRNLPQVFTGAPVGGSVSTMTRSLRTAISRWHTRRV